MSHEKSQTVTIGSRKNPRYANIDTVGQDAGTVLDGLTFEHLIDALIEARTRSRFGKDGNRRNPAARKNPRDQNPPVNPKVEGRSGAELEAIINKALDR